MFVNRVDEVAALRAWWSDASSRLGLVWGRRRVGKTALLQHVAGDLPTVFHTGAGRPVEQDLRLLSHRVAGVVPGGRDLERNPLRDHDDLFDHLARADEQVLLVLDEFPEMVSTSPELPGVLRAHLDDPDARLKVLLAGSAVRSMEALQEARAPLYGRVDLALQVHPFRPHEAALMLPGLPPDDLALVTAIVGGVPMYLRWWDAEADVAHNLRRLVATPGGRLLVEGQLVLSTEAESGDLAERTLRAVAAGRTRHSEVSDAVRADATRTLDRLVALRLLERLVPVTDDPRRTRRRVYRVADDFLAFWLGVVDRHRTEIERGLGEQILPALLDALPLHAGPRWEAAVRDHLRRLASTGGLGDGIVAVGPWWRDAPQPVEIDALVLRGPSRSPVLAAEAKWSTSVDAGAVTAALRRKVARVDGVDPGDVALAVAARGSFEVPDGVRRITTADVFGR